MAKVLVTDTNLTNIANAIRGKNGETTSYKIDEMASAIENIETGGGSIGGSSGAALSNTRVIIDTKVLSPYTMSYSYFDSNTNKIIYVEGDSQTTINVLQNSLLVFYDAWGVGGCEPVNVSNSSDSYLLHSDYSSVSVVKIGEYGTPQIKLET